MLVYVICFLRVMKKCKKKRKWVAKKFFINVYEKIAGLSLTYLQVRRRTQGYIFLGKKMFYLLVNFSESYFVSIDETTFLAIQNK